MPPQGLSPNRRRLLILATLLALFLAALDTLIMSAVMPTIVADLADLRLAKAASAASVVAGGRLTYTLTITNAELLELACDILLPAAMANQIHAGNARNIRAKLVVEGANGPTTPPGDAIVREKGIWLIPDFLANAGGVTCSYFEQVQSNMNYFWERDDVLGRLDNKMTAAYQSISQLSRKQKIYMRDAAYVVAINRVAAADAGMPATGGLCGEATPDPANLAAVHPVLGHAMVDYGPVIEEGLKRITENIPDHGASRWQAVKLLAGDEKVLETLDDPKARDAIGKVAAGFAEANNGDPDTILARLRYAFIAQLCADLLHIPTRRQASLSDRIDRVAMHPVWGVPIFLGLMYVVFTLTFTLGAPLMDLIDQGFGHLADFITGLWPAGAESPLKSLLVDGVIGGVGGVLVFLPNIVLLFLAIALLEGTGYMARAAYVMDRFMSRVGLHGKSFIPLLIGFGCTVPAVMATRTLETRRDRLTTMMILPLMSCSARLTVYALVIPAFFAQPWRAPMLWLMYVIGILLAVGAAMRRSASMARSARNS